MPKTSRARREQPSLSRLPRIEVFSRLGELFLSFSRTLTSFASAEIRETNIGERPVTVTSAGFKIPRTRSFATFQVPERSCRPSFFFFFSSFSLSVHSTSSNTSVDIDVFIKPREADEWNLHDVTINRFDLFSFFFFLYRRSIASYERINNNLPPLDKSLSNDYRARIIHFRSTNVELIISGGGEGIYLCRGSEA